VRSGADVDIVATDSRCVFDNKSRFVTRVRNWRLFRVQTLFTIVAGDAGDVGGPILFSHYLLSTFKSIIANSYIISIICINYTNIN